MGGTILNMLTVFIGSLLGLSLGHRLPQAMQSSVVSGLGLVTLAVGMQNALQTGNIIIPLLAVLLGIIVGETLQIDAALTRFGAWLQTRVSRGQDAGAGLSEQGREPFITGFVTASLVFCVGPLTFAGSIQDGMGLASGFQFLAIKSALDFFAAIAFAASFGLGVAFTVLTILIVQGGLALLGMLLVGALSDPAATSALASSPLIIEMSAVGGVLLLGLGIVLLDIKKIRVANFLPALVIAPLLVAIAGALGIPVYPL